MTDDRLQSATNITEIYTKGRVQFYAFAKSSAWNNVRAHSHSMASIVDASVSMCSPRAAGPV